MFRRRLSEIETFLLLQRQGELKFGVLSLHHSFVAVPFVCLRGRDDSLAPLLLNYLKSAAENSLGIRGNALSRHVLLPSTQPPAQRNDS